MLKIRTHTHRPTIKSVICGFREPQKVQIHQNLYFFDQKTTFSLAMGKKAIKNYDCNIPLIKRALMRLIMRARGGSHPGIGISFNLKL